MNPFELPALYGAGLLTFVSPCVLPLVPLYLATLTGASVTAVNAQGRARLLLASAGFAAGLSAVFVLMGLAATAFGRLLVEHRPAMLHWAGLLVVLMGLKFLGVVRVPWLEGESRPWLRRVGGRGFSGGVLLGAGFALGWSPCIGPVLGGVLTWTATSASNAAEGALFLGAYALGLSTPLLLLALVASRMGPLLSFLKARLGVMEKVTGALLVGVGVLLTTDSLGALMPAEDTGPSTQAVAAEAAVCSGTGPCAIEGAPSDAVAHALPSGPAMVEFVSRSCPVCQRMAPVVAAAEKTCEDQATKTARIYVDDAQGRKTAADLGVRGVPTFVFFDARNVEVARLVGEQSLPSLTQAMEVTVGANCAGFRRLNGTTPPSPEHSDEGPT